MKTKIWHLIGDRRAGGSNHLVRNLLASRLSDRFDFSMLTLAEARAQLGYQKPDLIIFHYPCTWKYLPDLMQLKKSSPVYLCDHHYCQEFERNRVAARWRFRLMLKLSYTLVNGVLSVSQAQRQWMIEANLVKEEKVTVINPASPIEKMLQIQRKVPGSPLILGAYGRFAQQKGFDILLRAIAQLPGEHFHLHLGGYGPDEATLRQLAQGLPQVKLLGAIEDVPSFLSTCEVVVIPSRWEPWGLVALEARAAGKPILASAVDGLCEQVRGCGLLVPSESPSALAYAIATLPESPLEDWGEAGRASARGAWEEFLQEWDSFLERASR